jgi:acetyl esterase/lipase
MEASPCVIIIPDYRKSFEAPYPAALSLYARDRNEVKIAFQMPLYPMIDDRMNLDSAIDNIAPVWDSKSNYIAWKLYLGDLFETNEIPKYAAPARADSYKNMPTTITFVGDLEPFRDETIHYVQRLIEDHVKVYFNLYEGAYHAFEHISPNAKISKNAVKFMQDAFKREIEKT